MQEQKDRKNRLSLIHARDIEHLLCVCHCSCTRLDLMVDTSPPHHGLTGQCIVFSVFQHQDTGVRLGFISTSLRDNVTKVKGTGAKAERPHGEHGHQGAPPALAVRAGDVEESEPVQSGLSRWGQMQATPTAHFLQCFVSV